jgi:hypothetical protein
MSPDDARIIALSRTKIALLMLSACAMVVIGIWLLSLGDEEVIGSMHRNPAIVHGTGGVSIIVFGLFGLNKLFDRSGGPLRRALHSANYRLWGSPVVISSNTLKMDLAELLRLVSQYLQVYGSSVQSSPDRQQGVH